MKAIILYRPDSEHDTLVHEFIREYKHRTGKEIELMSLDTKEGYDMAGMYDIVQYPAVLSISEDGHLHNSWQGATLPLIDELSYYDHI